MRIITALGAITVLLMPATAQAQGTLPAIPTTTAPDTVTSAAADFGARGASSTGDTARYERYRDLGDGLYLGQFLATRAHNSWLLSAFMSNVGRRDQKYRGTVAKPGKLTAWGLWDQIPMLMSRTTQTLFVEDISTHPNVFTIPDSLQAQLQPATAPRSDLFAANAITFETSSERRIGQGGFEYLVNRDLTLRTILTYTNRQGSLPYGGSFGHSSLIEIPAPIRHSLADLDSNAEYTHGNWLFRGGLLGSWFHNDTTTAELDNPFQAVDTAAASSRARLSLAPSNSLLSVNGTTSVKLPGRSRATAYVSAGLLKDVGADLMPQTINSANLPAIQPLPRNTVDGEARTTAVNLTFTSRPVRLLDFSARYRLYDYDNRTPEFVMAQRVSYDNAPAAATYSTLGGPVSPLAVETEPFGVKRSTLDADMRLNTSRGGIAGVGYSLLVEDRPHRFFESTTENTFRLIYDAIGMSAFTVRTKYEHGQRRGDVTEEAKMELFNIGEQPAARNFDIASRDRDRITVLGSALLTGTLSFNGSAAVGRDNYVESGTFGLRDNKHQIYTGGLDGAPTDKINYLLSYSYERYTTMQNSRSANPPSGAANFLTYDQFVLMSSQPNATQQIADVRYDWSNTGADRVHSVIAGFNIVRIREKLDLRFGYDFNRAHSLYTYTAASNVTRTLPDDIDPGTSLLPPPTQLPLVKSRTQRGTFDAIYTITRRIGAGFSFWYEDYRVSDYTLDEDATPDLLRSSGTSSSVLLGYMYRPYTARTFWGRMFVHW